MVNQNNLESETFYPSVFKKVDSADVSLQTFQAHKKWQFTSGSDTSSFMALQGIYSSVLPTLGTELTYNDAANKDGSLQTITYAGINHLFYRYKSEPSKTFGPTDLNRITKNLFQTASILAIPQIRIGEGIKPASFTFTSSVSGSYESDRYGNIIDSSVSVNDIVPGCVFYEGFNEWFDSSRNTQYSQSQGVTAVDGVPTTSGAQQPIGFAGRFTSSSNSYLSFNTNTEFSRDTDYAISFFIKTPGTASNYQYVIGKGISDTVAPFSIKSNGSNSLVFEVSGGEQVVYVSGTTILNTWRHFVAQKSGSEIQLYQNGILFASASHNMLNPDSTTRIDNTEPIRIGYSGKISSNNLSLNADLDEVRIFNRALTQTQITALNNRNQAGSVLQSRVVGNVFSKQGIAVFSSADYRIADLLNTPFTASYRSTVSISEVGVIARVDAGDFNLTTNVSLTKDDNSTYRPFITGSDFAPYVTQIGLYNDAGQLLAVGKLGQAVKKRNDVDMNFVVRIDLDNKILLQGK